jgi:hypothetical protein
MTKNLPVIIDAVDIVMQRLRNGGGELPETEAALVVDELRFHADRMQEIRSTVTESERTQILSMAYGYDRAADLLIGMLDGVEQPSRRKRLGAAHRLRVLHRYLSARQQRIEATRDAAAPDVLAPVVDDSEHA